MVPASDLPPLVAADNRSVGLFCALAVLNHVALTGGRVAVALGALAEGASSFTVGILVALFAVLPMLLSVHSGRWVDRIGVWRPMRVATLLLILGCALPCAIADTRILFVSSCATGIGCMLFQIATQNLLGHGVAVERRMINFARFALAMSISGFAGPLLAGLAIDHLGYRWGFGLLMLGPCIAMAALIRFRRLLPKAIDLPGHGATPQFRGLFANPMMRRTLIATFLLAGAWDLNSFMVPVYGSAIGLSATTIGVILSAFAAATFAVRLFLPWIQRRLEPWVLLQVAMVSAGAVYVVYPFFSQVPVLIALAFLMGLALGSGQPSLLTLLHTYAPPGRVAEMLGLRMGLINCSQVSLPLTFGLVGAVAGVGLPFWTMATCLLTGAMLIRSRTKTDAEPPSEP